MYNETQNAIIVIKKQFYGMLACSVEVAGLLHWFMMFRCV